MLQQNFLFSLLLTVIAGLSTGLGGLSIQFMKGSRPGRMLPLSLGLSAGVMIYVSFIELFQEARQQLLICAGETGDALAVVGFFGGMALIVLIDRLIPESSTRSGNKIKDKRLHRVGILTALGIVIHNFPEGIATFVSGMKDVRLGIVICTALAIHNIPEGIAVAVPIYYATGSRKAALRMAFLSGMAEPVGAVVGMLLMRRMMNDTFFGLLLAAVSGIMVFISLNELFPASLRYGKRSTAIFGLIAGMAVMALTLLLL